MNDINFGIGQVVHARDRLWRIERTIIHNSEFVEGATIPLLQVSSIDGVQCQCCLFPEYEEINLAEIKKPDITQLGNPAFQKVLVQAFRFDLIFGASSFVSLANSRVIPVSYQMVPVLMALAQEHVRLLIADDVGLGKTIEAGLILQELLGRKKINRVLFVVPASLREQWQESMRKFFGIDARIISRQTRRQLERELLVGGEPWGYFNFLITSQDYLSKSEILERATQFQFDAVVIDEAHNVAKPRHMVTGKGNKQQKRHNVMAERLAKYNNLIMLTATPHNGYHESFASLIYLLDPALVDEKHDWAIDRENAKRHICQRRKQDVLNWLQGSEKTAYFPAGTPEDVLIEPNSQFNEVIRSIDKYAQLVIDGARSDTAGVRYIKFWAVLHMYRRFISSPQAIIKSIENKFKDEEESTSEALVDPNNLKSEEIEETLDIIRNNVSDQESPTDAEEFEVDRQNDSEVGRRKLSADIRDRLTRIKDAALQALGYTADVKLQNLYNNVLPTILSHTSKVIIFSRYIDTVDYLRDQLKKLANEKKFLRDFEIFSIVGTEPLQVRQEKYARFLPLEKGILVATDCMSEGMDLQYSSNAVINYELPWNPNRLEQRFGRVNRFGQPEPEVFLRTLILKESLEIAILDLLYRKIQSIGQDTGAVSPYFGNMDVIKDVIDDYMTNNNFIRFGQEISPDDQQQMTLDAWLQQPDSEMRALLEKHLNFEFSTVFNEDSFYGQTVVDFTDVQKRMQAVQETMGDTAMLLEFLWNALPFFESSIEEINQPGYPTGSVFKITLSDALNSLVVGNSQRQTEFLVTTDAVFGCKNADVETLSLKSPVLGAVIASVRERGFLAEDEFYGRTAAVTSPNTDVVVTVLYYKIRYLVNTRVQSIMEELLPIGVRVFTDPASDGGSPLLENQVTEQLWTEYVQGKTANYPGNPRQALRDIEDLFGRQDYDDLIDAAAQARLAVVIDDAARLFARFQEKNLAALEDLEGMDDIRIISKDPISVTLFYPPVG